jgi:MFS family permease
MLVAVLGGSLTARQQALTRSVTAIPESGRGFRVDRFGVPLDQRAYRQEDASVQRVLGSLSGVRSRRVVFFRELRVQGELVEIASADQLAQIVRLRSGHMPRTCTPVHCEVLQVGAAGRAELAEGDVRLSRVGIADLRDPTLFGYISAATRGGASRPTLLLAPSVDSLQGLPSLVSFYRVYSWLAPLRVDHLRTWEIGHILAAESRAQQALDSADSAFRLSSPDDALLDAQHRGKVAARRLVLVGGEASALLLGFAIIAAIGLRRGLASERRRLLARGARRWQIGLELAAEIGSMTLAGAVAGVLVGAGIAAGVADAADLPPWAVLHHALLTGSTVGALLGGWLVATAALVLTTFARDEETEGRRLRLVDVAALGAAATIGVALSRGALDPDSVGSGNTVLLLILPALVCFVVAVVLARILAPAMRVAERLSRRWSVSFRLAVLALARAPSRTVVSCAFVAVALGLALFAASYRATLAQGADDQAAFQVPLDFTVSEGSRLVLPLDAASLARYESIGKDVQAHPVVRLSATTPGRGSSVLSPTVVGLPAEAVGKLRWRSDYSSLSPGAIARRLAASGEPSLAGALLPAGTRTLSITGSARGADVLVGLVVADPRGRIESIRLGRLQRGASTLTVSLQRTQPARIVGIQLSLPENEVFTHAHQEAEGSASQAPTGTLRLGPLVVALASGPHRVVTSWNGWVLPSGGGASRTAKGVRITFAFQDTGARLLFRPVEPTDGRAMPAVVSSDIARAAGGVRKRTVLDFQDAEVPVEIVGVARRLPTVPSDTQSFVLADRGWLSTAIDAAAPGEGEPNEVWISASHDRARVAAALARPPFDGLVIASRADIAKTLADDPLARATGLALGAAGIVALVLAVLGFWIGVVSELRDERSDFVDLEAQGVPPESLRAQLRTRGIILVGLGLVGGIGLGALLSQLVVSVIRVSGTTGVPEPPLRFDPAWLVAGAGVGAMAASALLIAEGTALAAFRAPRPDRAAWSLE